MREAFVRPVWILECYQQHHHLDPFFSVHCACAIARLRPTASMKNICFLAEASLLPYFHEAEKRKSGDLARGAYRVNFVILRSLFSLPISWCVLSFPMSGTSRKFIFVYVLGVQKERFFAVAAQRSTHIVASYGCFKPMCGSPGHAQGA